MGNQRKVTMAANGKSIGGMYLGTVRRLRLGAPRRAHQTHGPDGPRAGHVDRRLRQEETVLAVVGRGRRGGRGGVEPGMQGIRPTEAES